MLKEYPKFKRGQIEIFYNSLPRKEKEILSSYLEYRRARGITQEEKVKDVRRYILHIRYILDKDFKLIVLQDLRSLLAIINSSRLSGYANNTIKTDLKNFLKYRFPNWSERFNNLDDIKLLSNPRNEKKLNSQTLLQKEDIEKIMKHETKNYWKAFFLTQFEGALRTVEVRFLRWEDVKLDIDGDISELSIYSTKTKKSRPVFVKEASFYLSKLKEEQENTKKKGVYIFHSKKDINQPVDKHTVSMWFRNITQKALGRKAWCYLLRHSRATELYRLAKQGKISKDTAIEFMGHSEDMSKVYSHFDSKEIKEMLKSQIYKLEDLPEEKKHELELEIERLKKGEQIQKDRLERLEIEFRELFENFKNMTAGLKISHETAISNKSVEDKFRKTAKHLISRSKLPSVVIG